MTSVAARVVEAHGARIPLIGLGTWELRGRACVRVVEQAVRLGYRHVDTAELYDNEGEVGEGLRASGIKREQVFVTTKVWPSHFAPRDLERSAQASLSAECPILLNSTIRNGRNWPIMADHEYRISVFFITKLGGSRPKLIWPNFCRNRFCTVMQGTAKCKGRRRQ